MIVFLYRITDAFGNHDEAATSEQTDAIFLQGKDIHGGNVTFETELRHLNDFALEVGWTVEKFTLLVDLDTQKVISFIED